MKELILPKIHQSLMSVVILRLEYIMDQCFDHLAWTSASSQEKGELSKPSVMQPSPGRRLL